MLLLAGLIYSAGFLSECGPAVDPTTTRAIIKVESGGNPLAIGDNNLRKSFAPRTRDEAIGLASSFIAQGHSVDLGLMQINNSHLVPMRLSLDEVFDACRNVQIGTAILSGFYNRYPNKDPGYTLFNALSAYNTGAAWKGAGYVNKILAAAGVDYRVVFVPVEGSANGRPETDSKRKAGVKSSDSPLFFRNTTTAMVPRRGF